MTCSPDGRQIWASIGAADAMPIAVARERAKAILQRVRSGLPPVEPKAETFGAVVATWRKRHVEANGLRSAPEINRLLAAHILPAWKDREFTSICRSDVASLLDKVEDKHGARAADYVLNITRAVMNWYATRSDDYVPPLVRGMKRQKTMPRFSRPRRRRAAEPLASERERRKLRRARAPVPAHRAALAQGGDDEVGRSRSRKRRLDDPQGGAREGQRRRSGLARNGARHHSGATAVRQQPARLPRARRRRPLSRLRRQQGDARFQAAAGDVELDDLRFEEDRRAP